MPICQNRSKPCDGNTSKNAYYSHIEEAQIVFRNALPHPRTVVIQLHNSHRKHDFYFQRAHFAYLTMAAAPRSLYFADSASCEWLGREVSINSSPNDSLVGQRGDEQHAEGTKKQNTNNCVKIRVGYYLSTLNNTE